MRDIFVPIGHEGLFIPRASAKANHDCLLTRPFVHGAQRGKRRKDGRRSRASGSANEFPSAPRYCALDPDARSQIAKTRKFSQLIQSRIVVPRIGAHLVTAFELETSGFSPWVDLACVLIGLSSASSASASSCFIFFRMARCSSASCFWCVRL